MFYNALKKVRTLTFNGIYIQPPYHKLCTFLFSFIFICYPTFENNTLIKLEINGLRRFNRGSSHEILIKALGFKQPLRIWIFIHVADVYARGPLVMVFSVIVYLRYVVL